MHHSSLIGTDLERARSILSADGLVAIPTETVYGLGGNALSEQAVSRIFAAKDRPSFDPLIVHIGELEAIEKWTLKVDERVKLLAERFWPGPLTILLPRNNRIPDMVTAGSPLVALRMPDHPLTLELLQSLDFPLAAPSANPFGYISPTKAQHVADQLGKKVDYILDGGPCRVGLESTIIGFPAGNPLVYRKGGIAIEQLERLLGEIEVRAHSVSNPEAPGMLKSHYAPGLPFFLGDMATLLEEHAGKKAGLISFQKRYESVPVERQVILSPDGDLTEAARNLFAGMRRLDNLALDVILAEPVPERGLGRAINDRLRRAAAR
jgi:L-threonylcarbamoyladenylate synthase